VLQAVGLPDVDITMKQKVMDKIMGEKHHIARGIIEKLPELLADPIMVFNSPSGENRFIVLIDAFETETKEKHKGKKSPIIVAIGNKGDINRIFTVFGKSSDEFFVERITSGNLLYIDKKKSQQFTQKPPYPNGV
jgi:hypothetical protein